MEIEKQIGKPKHKIIISDEYLRLSLSDEKASHVLAQAGLYEQACYFLLQAMEKTLRAKIFTKVNAELPFFREKNKSHSIEDAVNFLVEVIGHNDITRTQIKQQIIDYALKNTRYSQLHNNLRYPYYSQKHNSFSKIMVGYEDFAELEQRLIMLRKFLKDF